MEKIWLKSYDRGVPENIDPDQFKNINEMLSVNFKKYANDPCLVSLRQPLSYEEVDSLSNQFAAYLQNELGFKKGMRLALLMPNILQTVIAMLGVLRLGGIVVNLPFTLPPDDIHKLIKLTEPTCVVVFENFSPNLEIALKGTSVNEIIFTEFGDLFKPFKRKLVHYYMRFKKKIKPCQIPNAIPFRKILQTKFSHSLQNVDVLSSDTAFLLFTNARDQALPKCVELTHRNLVANTLQAIAALTLYWNGNPVKTTLCLFPLFRGATILHLFAPMSKGFQTILIPDPTDIDAIVSECKSRPFSNTIGIQLLFERYLKSDRFCEMNFSKLRLTLGGGVISSQTAVMWKVLTETMVIKTHIMTEATSLSIATPLSMTEYSNSLGVPLSSTEMKVCDRKGNEVGLNKRGELWLRGPQVMKGYWRDPEQTSQVLTQDGWLKTGDIVVVDEQGYVTMVERMADMLEHQGEFGSALDIESLIATVPDVVESAVVSVKQASGDAKIKAYVVRKDPGLNEETIMELCRRFLIEFCPHEIIFIGSLPRASVGYIMKRALRERG